MDAIRLVARCNHDALDELRTDAARLEQIPGTSDIRLEGRQRRARCGSYDRLRAEMENRIDLELVQNAYEDREVFELAAHYTRPLE